MARAVKGGVGGIRAVVCGAVVAGLAGGCGADHGGMSSISQGGSGGTTPAGAGGAVGMAGAGGDPGRERRARAATAPERRHGRRHRNDRHGRHHRDGRHGRRLRSAGGRVVDRRRRRRRERARVGGGTIHVVARGAVTVGASPTPPPPLPAPPADAIAVDGAALGADVTAAGSIRLDGTLTAGGGDAVRQITSTGGDIFVSGTLRGGDAGGASRGLSVSAPAGTVYVTGAIDSSRPPARAQAGGPIAIAAQRVVMTGSLSANGADGGGRSGGRSPSPPPTWSFWAGRCRCGAARARPPPARAAHSPSTPSGAVQARRTIDARGGAGSGAAAIAGAGGAIRIGEQATPSLVNLSAPLSARGGMGGVVGGAGGAVTLEPHAGNLVIAGSVDLGGGAAASQPGAGGTFLGLAGAGVGDDVVERRRHPAGGQDRRERRRDHRGRQPATAVSRAWSPCSRCRCGARWWSTPRASWRSTAADPGVPASPAVAGICSSSRATAT